MGKKLSPYGRKEWHRKHSGNKTYTRALMPFSVEQERLEELRQRCPPERLA